MLTLINIKNISFKKEIILKKFEVIKITNSAIHENVDTRKCVDLQHMQPGG